MEEEQAMIAQRARCGTAALGCAGRRRFSTWEKHSRGRLCHTGGFTLIESAVAVVVVGVGIVAMLGAMASGSRINAQAQDITQGVFLAQEIREWTLRVPFRDPSDPNSTSYPYTTGLKTGENPQDANIPLTHLDELMNVTFSPPRDGEGVAITGLTAWNQAITMVWRDPDLLTNTMPNGTTPVICVTVNISHNNQFVTSASWIVTNK